MKTRKPNPKINYQIRQGDVLIERINDKTHIKGEDAKKRGRAILAEGEVTGHCHEVVGDAVNLVHPEVPAQDFEYLLTLGRDAVVAHPDHRPEITIKQGQYKSIPQMQYTPLAIMRDRD